ncbi:MAG: 8-oxo-dGTP diphosphatase [Reinekea sp.]|jgi:8-oxo-dGTP diphosphatase
MFNSEKSFLSKYDAKEFPVMLVTVDTVLLTYHEDQLKVLLVKRANYPEKGKWGLPGGFLNQQSDDSLEAAAIRSIQLKTSVKPGYMEQVATVGSEQRDPRGWSVSVVYTALMPHEQSAFHIESVEDVRWVSVETLSTLEIAFDHQELISLAVLRHKQKALYSFVPVFALTQPFTLTELRRVHELLIGKSIQRKSFIRRAEASEMLVDTGKLRQERGRPATLYRAKPKIADYRFVRNIEAD